METEVLSTSDNFETRMSSQIDTRMSCQIDTSTTSIAETPKGYSPNREDTVLKILNTAETLKDHLKLMKKTGKVTYQNGE